jgi:hypothetical protein
MFGNLFGNGSARKRQSRKRMKRRYSGGGKKSAAKKAAPKKAAPKKVCAKKSMMNPKDWLELKLHKATFGANPGRGTRDHLLGFCNRPKRRCTHKCSALMANEKKAWSSKGTGYDSWLKRETFK